MIELLKSHPFAVLGILAGVAGLTVAWLWISGIKRAASLPNSNPQANAATQKAVFEAEQAKAQARAQEILHAPDDVVDARVEQLRERGRSGK